MPTSPQRPSGRRAGAIIAAILAVVIASAVLFRVGTEEQAKDTSAPDRSGAPTRESDATSGAPRPEITAFARPTAPPLTNLGLTRRPVIEPLPTPSAEQLEALDSIEPAPLGTFAVAKPNAGVPLVFPPFGEEGLPLEIPVFDEPYGEARALDSGQRLRLPLLHYGLGQAPLVLRVVAGGPDDDWLKVHAPSGGRSFVWVRGADFDVEYTSTRIEIDKAVPRLRLIQGGSIVLETTDVRGTGTPASRPAVHLVRSGMSTGETYSLGGQGGYVLGGFDEAPRDFFRAVTINPAVMQELVARVQPGTPIVIFNSSRQSTDREAVIGRELTAALTVRFDDVDLLVKQSAPQESALWHRCQTTTGSICEQSVPSVEPSLPIGNVFVTATEAAGDPIPNLGSVVPVYDTPGGERRVLVDRNALLAPGDEPQEKEPADVASSRAPSIGQYETKYPLLHPTVLDQPLVLRVIQGAPGDEWLLVQAPIRPHRQNVWIRSEGFVFGETTKRIEVDLADGTVTMLQANEPILSTSSVYGRKTRPTTLHDTYVEQKFEGARLSPAYGAYILTLASYSEALATFGGGGLPGQSLHGTNQPELVGQRVSSGGIRIADDMITVIYLQPDIVGASVIIYDSTGIGRRAAIELQRNEPWTPAATTTYENSEIVAAPLTSYS